MLIKAQKTFVKLWNNTTLSISYFKKGSIGVCVYVHIYVCVCVCVYTCVVLVFETGFHYVALVGLEQII